MTHLRKAIEREAERLTDINYRQYFYVVAWFLQAEQARRERQKKDCEIAKLQADFEPESFGLVAGVLNQETFITLNRYMQQSFDNKEWQDLNASMRCFTQILMTVQEMTLSPLEDDQEIADNIQNRIFYEETTHDRIISILKGYKDQGLGYLDACTELSHVFLRMLERYSKENADLQIRSRRRARRKKKEETKQELGGSDEVDENDRSENEDVADVAQISRERKFDFTRFAAKFTSQSSVDTYFAFITFYRDLSVEQLKRAHRFFYRVAFKQELAVLLYRIDIIALFYKMINGPEGLDLSHVAYKDWSELTRQLFKKLFKKLDQRPELMVELLFSKINATLHYLEYGREKQTMTSTRAPAELEVKPAPGRGIKDKIGIVIAALQQEGKVELVQWIKLTLAKAIEERQGWEGEAAARPAPDEFPAEGAESSKEQNAPEPPRVPSISELILWMNNYRANKLAAVRATNEDIASAMFKNVRLKLLMTLVGFERLGVDDAPEATWIVPAGLTSSDLEQTRAIVERFELTPWVSEDLNDSPEGLLRRVRYTNREDDEDIRRDAFIDDSEGEDGLEDFMFPDNPRTKSSAGMALDDLKKERRKRMRNTESEPFDDDVAEARRKAREAAALDRRRKIKSGLYIRDSVDEDEAVDREFFAREEEGRKRQAERVKQAMMLSIAPENKKSKKRKSAGESDAPRKRRASDDSENEQSASDEDVNMMEGSSPTSQQDDATSDEIMEDTPLSSQSQDAGEETVVETKALKELRQPPAETKEASKGDPESEVDNEVPVASSRRAGYRAGFVIDSDDE